MRQRLVHCLFREPTWQPETVRLDLLRPGRGWGRNIGSRKNTESAVSEQDTRTGLMPRTEFGPRVRLAFATNSRATGMARFLLPYLVVTSEALRCSGCNRLAFEALDRTPKQEARFALQNPLGRRKFTPSNFRRPFLS